MVQAAPAVLAGRAASGGRAVSVVQAGLAGQVALEAPADPGGRAGLAVRADLGGREALAVLAGPAAGKPLTVRRDVLAVALARWRGPPTVLLGGRTSAGREARPWAV